ncbi:MAG: TRAP transporter substrate-binding protein DctP [Desulfobacterium sp.]
MKKRNLRNWFFVTAVFIALGAMLIAPKASQASDTIRLKAVTSFPKNGMVNRALSDLIAMIDKQSNGRLKINYMGGPEVIKSFDQGEAIRRGTIDMILYTPFGYLKSFAPVLQAKGLSQLTSWEERQTGVHDIWDRICQEKIGAKYLGTIHSVIDFSIYTSKKVEKIADFKGLKIRAMPLYTPFIQKLGAKPIIIPPTDVYTAMQRGVVDGYMFTTDFEIPDWGWHEVTKYKIVPGVFQLENATLINLKKYNSLPKDLQQVLEHCVEVFEGVDTVRILREKEQGWEKMKAAGVQEIHLEPAEAERFVKMAYDETWAAIIKDAPEDGPMLKKMISKPLKK